MSLDTRVQRRVQVLNGSRAKPVTFIQVTTGGHDPTSGKPAITETPYAGTIASVGPVSEEYLTDALVQVGDLTVTIAQLDLQLVGFLGTPKASDRVTLDGRKFDVIKVVPKYAAVLVSQFDLICRAGG